MNNFARLNANENLLGPSPVALEAILEAATNVHVYPLDEGLALREKLAARIGGSVSAENFVIGNGSGDILRMIIQTYVLPGSEVIIPSPTFISYKRLTGVHRGRVIEVPLIEYQVDLLGIVDAITPATTLIFLCNPNNPTGQIVTHEQMGALLAQIPDHVTVVVDEAYVDFATDPRFPNMLEFIDAGYNVIVARTFSKVYGLASLRVGYGYGQKEAVTRIRNTRHFSDSGRMAYLGAAVALTDEAHIVNTQEMVISGRDYFYVELAKLGLSFLRSEGFFVLLTDLPLDAQFIVDEAHKHGVLIRHTDVFDMPGYVRISIGRKQDNERAIAALRAILTENGLL